MKSTEQRARDLEKGRESYARRAWADAYEALAGADASEPLEAEDLERLAWSASLRGLDEELLRLLERVYQHHFDAGNAARAARAAFWLGFRLMNLGEFGRASGWLSRAQRLVEEEAADCAVRGYLLLPVAYRHVGAGEFEIAHATVENAIEIGQRSGDRDLLAFAHSIKGRVLICREEVDGGLALLDEAMLAVTTGELSPLVTGFIYCNVISCCQKVYEVKRAREWTQALTTWCEGQPELVTFTGSCLVHRSEIMQLGGAWPEAIEEARRATERFTRPTDQDVAASAYYQQAEIHRLRGEFASAEEAYRHASELGREPQPGLALLRLAEGRSDVSASAIRRVLGATSDRLERARLLPASIEILLAVGELDEAKDACRELAGLAAGLGTEVLGAIALHARGAVLLAEGDALGALDPLRRAFNVWQAVGAPYLSARLRVLVGRACRALGDEDGTVLELGAARSVFERLGASPDVARVDSLLKPAAPERSHGLTVRELEVLRLVACGKTNKAIAKELSLSEKTVDRHVSNIFTKVNVPTRAAATAFAYRNRLL
jgi:DNA-binding CsgD family transcriptional regulator